MDKARQTYISVLKAEVQHLKSKLEPTDTGHIHTTISTLQHRIKEFDLTSTRLLRHYKKCTRLKEKEIREKLMPPHDVWLDAKEAKKLGLCDEVQEMGKMT